MPVFNAEKMIELLAEGVARSPLPTTHEPRCVGTNVTCQQWSRALSKHVLEHERWFPDLHLLTGKSN